MGVALKLFDQYRGVLSENLQFFDAVDLDCARRCLPDGTDGQKLLISTLSQAVRQGHLCLSINQHVIPSTQTLFGENFDDQLIEAAKTFPVAPYIHRENERFYFEKYWVSEHTFCQHLQRLIHHPPSISLDEQRIESILHSCENLLPEQAQAIRLASANSLSIISGGPGTGKTYTAGMLIQILWEAMTPEQRASVHFALTAPTGKAAIHLQKSFQRVCQNLPGFSPLQAQTLHSLLGKRRASSLMSDVILVDESSMIDVQLMAKLLASVKSGARLIFLGDSHQLPPVEAGSLFTDMIAQLKEVGQLTQCLRVELEGIRTLADAIYRGLPDQVFAILDRGESGIKRLKFSEKRMSTTLQEIVADAVQKLPTLSDFSYQSIKQYLESFCLLSPLRKGLFGVDRLNQEISLKLKTNPIRPILITKNDPAKGLYNGDTGVLVNGEYALFLDNEGSLKRLPALLLPPYDYAYCLSVHKSQGSEFDHVMLLMPPGAESFGAELFYTGVTRAKKQIEIWGSDDVLRASICKKNYRHSGLKFDITI